MEFKSVVRNRYSCKKYSSRVPEQEKLDGKEPSGTAYLCSPE